MSLYTLALFLHVSGAFVCLGIWLYGLAAMFHTQFDEQVNTLTRMVCIASPHMVLSVLLLWGTTSWMRWW